MQDANEGRVAPRIDRPKPDEPLAGEIVCWSALEHRALESDLLSAEIFHPSFAEAWLTLLGATGQSRKWLGTKADRFACRPRV